MVIKDLTSEFFLAAQMVEKLKFFSFLQ